MYQTTFGVPVSNSNLKLFVGDTSSAMKTLHNYHQVWRQLGFTPEFYNIPQNEPGNNRESYPLRPELIESVMYLYRATGDPYLLDVGVDILRSIQHSGKTPCGYATVRRKVTIKPSYVNLSRFSDQGRKRPPERRSNGVFLLSGNNQILVLAFRYR